MESADLASSPQCPDGHGSLAREAGFWFYGGVNRADDEVSGAAFRPNGKGLVVKVWVCPTCKLVRTYADDEGA